MSHSTGDDCIVKTEKELLERGEVVESFARASGPGGQNVNKVSSAVLLKFNVRRSNSISDYVKERILSIAASKINSEGELLIKSSLARSQWKNREDAWKKLLSIIEIAGRRTKPRKETKPSFGEKKRRLDSKKAVSKIKDARKKISSKSDD